MINDTLMSIKKLGKLMLHVFSILIKKEGPIKYILETPPLCSLLFVWCSLFIESSSMSIVVLNKISKVRARNIRVYLISRLYRKIGTLVLIIETEKLKAFSNGISHSFASLTRFYLYVWKLIVMNPSIQNARVICYWALNCVE